MRLRPIVHWSVGLGLGLGVVIGAGLGARSAPQAALTDAEIIERARTLGMRPLTELAGSEVTLTVGPGTTAAQLAEALVSAGVITDRKAFLSAAGTKSPLANVYHVRPGEELSALISRFFPS